MATDSRAPVCSAALPPVGSRRSSLPIPVPSRPSASAMPATPPSRPARLEGNQSDHPISTGSSRGRGPPPGDRGLIVFPPAVHHDNQPQPNMKEVTRRVDQLLDRSDVLRAPGYFDRDARPDLT